MEQHPIPQNISSYQFRLVGDMTLKQFFQVAAGAVISLIIYSLPLHSLIKWPLMLFFALAGVALAFLPFEDRPLEKWVIAFFRSVYSPTIFMWRKAAVTPKYFRDEVLGEVTTPTVPGVSPEKLESYFAETGETKTPFAKKLDSYEKSFLSGIGSLFGATGAREVPAVVAPAAPIAPKEEIKIPTIAPIKVPQGPATSTSPPPSSQIPQSAGLDTISPLSAKGFGTAGAAEFFAGASPPAPPTVPNTVVGQVLDSQGKIIESAILEVRDAAGRPVRALRTNKLGHFMVVTPLASGPYELFVEKEGFEFDPARFDAVGEIIPPIVVRAETTATNSPTAQKSQVAINP